MDRGFLWFGHVKCPPFKWSSIKELNQSKRRNLSFLWSCTPTEPYFRESDHIEIPLDAEWTESTSLKKKKYHETDHRSNHYTKVIIHIFFIFRILCNSWNWELTNSHVFDAFLEHSTLAIEMMASQATHLTCLPPLCPEARAFPLYYVWFSEEEQYSPWTYEWPPLLTSFLMLDPLAFHKIIFILDLYHPTGTRFHSSIVLPLFSTVVPFIIVYEPC